MAQTLAKVIEDHYGESGDGKWHFVIEGDTLRTLCEGIPLDAGDKTVFKSKTVEKGGTTCEKCIELVRYVKSIKL